MAHIISSSDLIALKSIIFSYISPMFVSGSMRLDVRQRAVESKAVSVPLVLPLIKVPKSHTKGKEPVELKPKLLAHQTGIF